MSRLLGGVLILLGTLIAILGLLARPFIHDRVAVLPLDQSSTTTSVGEDMKALYPHRVGKTSRLDKLDGVRLVSTRQVRGIPGKAEDQDVEADQAFWQTTVKSQAEVNGELVPLSYSDEGASLDRRTGTTTNCCGDYRSIGTLEDPTKTEKIDHEGQMFTMPFNAQKQDYPWWDGDLQKAVPASFLREDTVAGVPVYVYEQQIPEQETATREVPGSLFGSTKPGNVTAKVRYANTRTLFVEPNTGVVIKGQEQLRRLLVAPDGTSVPVVEGTMAYDDATVDALADEYGSKGKALAFLRGPLMPLGLGLGIVLILLGLFLMARERRSRHA